MDYNFDCECGAELTAEVDCTYGGCEAKLYGPPENCYPAEGPEFDCSAVVCEAPLLNEEGDEIPGTRCGKVYDDLLNDRKHYDRILDQFAQHSRDMAEDGPEFEYD